MTRRLSAGSCACLPSDGEKIKAETSNGSAFVQFHNWALLSTCSNSKGDPDHWKLDRGTESLVPLSYSTSTKRGISVVNYWNSLINRVFKAAD